MILAAMKISMTKNLNTIAYTKEENRFLREFLLSSWLWQNVAALPSFLIFPKL